MIAADRRSPIGRRQTGLKRDDYFATIPSLPISYDTAHEILKVLAGPNVPSGWQGGLPLAYHVGPGPGRSQISVSMDYQIRKIWNVIATIPGTVEPDRWVMVGNHRDAWVYGAVDPGSGTAATLEMCRALGAAVKNGWKPRRTLALRELGCRRIRPGRLDRVGRGARQGVDEKAVLMLNVDSAVSGPELEMPAACPRCATSCWKRPGRSPTPRSGKSLRETWTEARRDSLGRQRAAGPRRPGLGRRSAATSHRDRIAGHPGFLPPNGLARLGLRLHGVSSITWRAGRRRRLQGRLWGLSLDLRRLQLDGEVRRPRVLDPCHGGPALHADRHASRGRRRRAAQFVPYGLALARACRRAAPDPCPKRARKADPAKTMPSRDSRDCTAWSRPCARFRSRPRSSTGPPRRLSERDHVDPRRSWRSSMTRSRKVERAFLLENGLPGRPWFKHAIYAPGLTTGYASWPLPAIRQALEDKNAARLAADAPQTVERIKKATAALETASADPPQAARDARDRGLKLQPASRNALADPDRDLGSIVVTTTSGASFMTRMSKTTERQSVELPRVLGPVDGVLRGRRLGDRLGDLPGPGQGGQRCPVPERHRAGLGHRRPLQRGRGADAGRAGGDAAAGGRSLCLPPRGLRSAAGVPVRLGRVPGRAVAARWRRWPRRSRATSSQLVPPPEAIRGEVVAGRCGRAGHRGRHRGQRPGHAAGRNASGRWGRS